MHILFHVLFFLNAPLNCSTDYLTFQFSPVRIFLLDDVIINAFSALSNWMGKKFHENPPKLNRKFKKMQKSAIFVSKKKQNNLLFMQLGRKNEQFVLWRGLDWNNVYDEQFGAQFVLIVIVVYWMEKPRENVFWAMMIVFRIEFLVVLLI